MDDNLTPVQQDAALVPQDNDTTYAPTIWNNDKLMAKAYKAAKYLASSDLVPTQTYKGKPENCLIAMDLANRMNVAPLLVMQNLYIVQGKPGWSGQFCVAAVNGCGRFSPLEFVTNQDGSVFARATDLRTGRTCTGTPITWDMVKGEGWLNKPGSKCQTLPDQMFRYRAAAFFARTFCPDVLMGLQTVEEIRDVSGYSDELQKQTTVIKLED